MKEQLTKYADQIVQDGLGSIFGVRKGQEDDPTILVCGHMDEVGFLVSSITDNGMIRFQTLGGWSPQVLQAQRVQIYTDQGPCRWCNWIDPATFIKRQANKDKVTPIKGFIDRYWCR